LPTACAPHYSRVMHVPRRLVSACLIVAALIGMAAVPASAAEPTVTEIIFGDYVSDRAIDGDYTASELSAALAIAEDDDAFSEFAAAVQEKYDQDILGLAGGSGPATAPFATDPAADAGTGFLPRPRGPGERDQPPWPLLALTALAGALVITGAGSSILRRARR
jgi:hypothetical protein